MLPLMASHHSEAYLGAAVIQDPVQVLEQHLSEIFA
jgi:hypothetical protein